MKRILLATLLALCMLSHFANAEEMFHYGRYWSGFSMEAKLAYTEGVQDAVSRTYFAASDGWLSVEERLAKPEAKRMATVRKEVFLMLSDKTTLINVMNDLYKDPANSYITTIDMLYIARDKLLGKSTDGQLQSARKKAVDLQEAVERMQREK